jgi:hypothetical protein
LLLLPALAFFGGGRSIVAGSGGGLCSNLGAAGRAFNTSSINAWVLLVKILR